MVPDRDATIARLKLPIDEKATVMHESRAFADNRNPKKSDLDYSDVEEGEKEGNSSTILVNDLMTITIIIIMMPLIIMIARSFGQ